jgi:hypothetical protein
MDWRIFLQISANHFMKTRNDEPIFWSWSSWTTFSRLERDSGYWTAPLPYADELLENSTLDGGMWGQPFPYAELAHVIIPRTFHIEKRGEMGRYYKEFLQDIDGLSLELNKYKIYHNIGSLAIDIKLY